MLKRNGYVQTQPNNIIKYSLHNIKNLSNTKLDKLVLTDYIPNNVDIFTLYTGTFNQNLEYSITYSTNKKSDVILAEKLSSSQTYKFELSSLTLESDEIITSISYNFENVDIGFTENNKPVIYCKVHENVSNIDIIHNEVEIVGYYKQFSETQKDIWDTNIYAKDIKLTPLPRTGK